MSSAVLMGTPAGMSKHNGILKRSNKSTSSPSPLSLSVKGLNQHFLRQMALNLISYHSTSSSNNRCWGLSDLAAWPGDAASRETSGLGSFLLKTRQLLVLLCFIPESTAWEGKLHLEIEPLQQKPISPLLPGVATSPWFLSVSAVAPLSSGHVQSFRSRGTSGAADHCFPRKWKKPVYETTTLLSNWVETG